MSGTRSTSRSAGRDRDAVRGSTRTAARNTGRGTATRSTARTAARTSDRSSARASRQSSRSDAASSRNRTAAKQKTSLFGTLANRLHDIRRKLRSFRAGKNFTRQFGSGDNAASAQAGPRAAVYKGEMGSSQRRAARMQNGGKATKQGFNVGFSLSGIVSYIGSSRARMIATVVICAVVFVSVYLYPSARQWYVSEREYQQAQAEYAAIVERNQALENDIAMLGTNEGIEQRAREQFGWVRADEHAVRITNIDATSDTHQNADNAPIAQVPTGSVEAPSEWYTPFLNVLFGVG